MAIKEWVVTAEVNMIGSRHDTVTVKANTERKARIKAVEEFKKRGHYFAANLKIKQKEE